jgi:signal transduction histidine kinase
MCAVDPAATAACLADSAVNVSSAAAQVRRWGMDQSAIARRLAHRWNLPRWINTIVGHLGLSTETAQSLGADGDLFRVVQTAIGLVQQEAGGLHLGIGTSTGENVAALGLSSADQESLLAGFDAGPGGYSICHEWVSLPATPLLCELLSLAAENQRLQQCPGWERLERERDCLHQALEGKGTDEAVQLQRLKLEALAEFAAGAAHEINNPLAVISGQAQYLLGRDTEPDRQRALQTIIGQSQRIHQLLTELMQFARPPRPQKQIVDLRSLVREVTLSLMDLALERQVQLLAPEPEQALDLYADPRQLGTALECLLRNAIEAAPAGGWARVQVGAPSPDTVEMVIEDNGAGPGPDQRDHLFDPFYSGRQAGRGRGLGLSTAWRLARQHGGDVRFEETASGPTRFVLSLPRQPEQRLILRPSA